jgi:hypothetical protein
MLGATVFVVIRNNAANAGGGMYAESKEFVVDHILAIVVNNAADYDAAVSVWPTTLTVLSGESVIDFASRPGAQEGMLPVNLIVSWYHGLPCEGEEVTAEFEGRYLMATNTSGEGGFTEFWLRMQRPPGFYNITFSVRDLPPAIVSLHPSLHQG